jgi:hypothetical protein
MGVGLKRLQVIGLSKEGVPKLYSRAGFSWVFTKRKPVPRQCHLGQTYRGEPDGQRTR